MSPSASWGLIIQDFPPELCACLSPELFLPPVLSAVPYPKPHEGSLLTPRCQTKLHPQRLTSRLLFSFHKEGHILQNRDLHPELCISAARERDSGLYWCEVIPEDGRVQKQSHQLEIRVWGKWGRKRDTPQWSGHWAVGPCRSMSRSP